MNTSSALRQRLHDWWDAKRSYPDPALPYVPTAHYDMMHGLRIMIRLMTGGILLIPALIVIAVMGYPVPTDAGPLYAVFGLTVMFATNQDARHSLASMVLAAIRRRWAEEWMDADAPMFRLWMLPGSPVTPAQFAAYAEAFADDPDSRIGGGTDPRLVWWLHGRGITPEQVAEYRNEDIPAHDAVLIMEAGLTVQDWQALTEAGFGVNWRTTRTADGHNLPERSSTTTRLLRQTLLFLRWVSTTRASLHPDQFHLNLPPRTVSECIPLMRVWTGFDLSVAISPFERLRVGDIDPDAAITADTGKEDSAPTAPEHRIWSRSQHRLAGRSVPEWTEVAGLLTPYFLAADIGLPEAEAMLADDPHVTAGSLLLLAAMR